MKPKKYTPDEEAWILTERQKGTSLKKIGEEMGVCGSAIRLFLERKNAFVKREVKSVSEESDNLWLIVKSHPLALAIAKKQPVADGFKGLLVYQSGRNRSVPKITYFKCEKNPGAEPGKREPGGTYDEHTT